MRLEIFDKNSRERIGMINKYKYVHYKQSFNGRGYFNIIVPLEEKSIPLLKKENYIWLEGCFVGIILYCAKNDSDDEKKEYEVRGYSLNHILSYRCIYEQTVYNDTVGKIASYLVRDNISMFATSVNRRVSFIVTTTNHTLEGGVKAFQVTGKDLEDTLESLYDESNFGYIMYPLFDKAGGKIQQIAHITLTPYDRTLDNKEGNTPVIFSYSMDNLSSISYIEDDTTYKNSAYVAGEGEGKNRKIVQVNDDIVGIDRKELFIDARDLQTEKSDGTTISDDVYTAQLEQRGKEKLKEKERVIVFDCSVNTASKFYKFGYDRFDSSIDEDYYLGDFVTIVDEETNRMFDLQVTEIEKTISEKGEEHFDIKFGKDKMTIREIVRKGGF